MFESIRKKVNELLEEIKQKEKLITKEEFPWYKWYGKIPKHLDYFEGSIYEKVYSNYKEYENYIALEYFNKKITYKSFINSVEKCAASLKNYGIKDNDVVSICMANTPEAIITFYAVNKIGGIANMIHPLSSENEIKSFVNEANTKILFINDMLYEKVKNIYEDLNVQNIIICNIDNMMDNLTKFLYNFKNQYKIKDTIIKDKFVLWNDFNIYNDKCETVKRSKDDDAVILYSGGTTGKNKGVVLSNLCFNAITEECHAMIPNTDKGKSMLSYLPIFHGFGLSICIHAPLSLGMKCILIPKLDTKKVNKVIKKKKPNFLPAIPSLLELITKDMFLSKTALKSVLCIVCGGDFLNIKLKEKTEKYFKDHGSCAKIRIGYGLTECTASTCASLIENYKSGSIGIPMSDNIYKIVKPNTNIQADINEIGEICINGPTVMKRYLNNEEETFKTLRVHDDGRTYLHTGDLGYIDEDGIFYYSTRLKRMIISNGCNIYPNEIENIFNKHPYIQTCVAVGIKDKRKAEAVKIIIVLKNDIVESENIEEELKEYAAKNIAKYALPKIYEFKKEIPKTNLGKTDYKKLKDE